MSATELDVEHIVGNAMAPPSLPSGRGTQGPEVDTFQIAQPSKTLPCLQFPGSQLISASLSLTSMELN